MVEGLKYIFVLKNRFSNKFQSMNYIYPLLQYVIFDQAKKKCQILSFVQAQVYLLVLHAYD